jgi:Phosphorylase superfamily
LNEKISLLKHPFKSPTAFKPKDLIEAVRHERNLPDEPIPRVCVLEFDGDLTDWLVSTGRAEKWQSWACFHTEMFSFEADGERFGIVPRTIGGPFSVLIAEQMAVSGAQVIIGLTSAGRVSSFVPVPALVVISNAVSDEGTSYHYLPPECLAESSPVLAKCLGKELDKLSCPVFYGPVWTTDASYRETKEQLEH